MLSSRTRNRAFLCFGNRADEAPRSVSMHRMRSANGTNEDISRAFEKLDSFRAEYQKQIEEISGRVESMETLLANKAEARAVPTLEQWLKLETDLQTSIRSNVKKIDDDIARVEAMVVALESKAEARAAPTLEQWQRVEVCVQDSSDTARKIDEVFASVENLAATLKSKANANDVPTLEQWKILEKDMRASPKGSAHSNGEEKSESKKVQMLVAAAGARFDRQLKELRQQVRDVSLRCSNEQIEISHNANDKTNVSEIEDPRWPGRVIRHENTDDDADSEIGRTPRSHCGSRADSYGSSVTCLGPEERAELQKIQAVVGAAGTAFSKEIRELKKQFNFLNTEVMGLAEHIKKASLVGA